MYSQENIATILEFRNLPDPRDGNATNKPSDELILSALDLIRKFHKTPEPNVILHTIGINTVIKFNWTIGRHGLIEYALSEDYLKLLVLDDDSNVIVADYELDNSEWQSIDFITIFFRRIVMGEIPNVLNGRN